MALYKYEEHVSKVQDAAFDAKHKPGVSAPFPGIYRCVSCGDEIAIAGGHTLPTQNHHQHRPGVGPIEWRLLVYPVQKK